jgi:Ca2+-binding RTX toxin-like protein
MFSLRKLGAQKRVALVVVLAMAFSGIGPAFLPQPALAQTAPIGNGFTLNASDVRFIFHAIEIAQDHAVTQSALNPCGTLLGPGPNQVNLFGVPNPQLPLGLRTVDGSCNNLVEVPDQHLFGAADQVFPRLTTPVFLPAQAGTSYTQTSGNVIDSEPRIISNLVMDQSLNNPAAAAAAANPCGSGGFVCSPPAGGVVPDPDSGAIFIPNITPDFGLSAPFNLMFTFFGQFFDHGLDLVNKGGSGNVVMPLQPDDPLFVPGGATNFMVLTRATNLPGPDGILGTADDIHDGINQTTPWVDQNQTYTSHPSHQVFLRQYVMVLGRPVPDGKVLDGGHCAPRGTGIPGDQICNIGTWADVKAQAATKLGIRLADQDIFDAPLILTDPYGHFKPGAHGFPQLVLPGNVLLEGNPAANAGAGISIPANAFRTGHAFLNDIAHNAAPNPGLVPDADTVICDFRTVPSCQPPGTYDDELLNAHFITGDGRGNENIGLTTVHQIFHAEHNRLVHYFDQLINTPGFLTPAEVAAWHAVHAPSGWGYGERLFQAARFGTEMQYQHLVFEEFARRIQPLINAFLGGITSINGAIRAEYAHTVYRLGHSMLPERLSRINNDGTTNDIRLFNAFLNPPAYNDGGPCAAPTPGCVAGRLPLSAADAAGSVIRGLTRQVGNELDEFVTSSVRNTLVGLPLDLPAINIARGRSEGIPPLNQVRAQFFNLTKDAAVQPYANWFEFGLALRHFDSLVNFVAAYGTDPTITGATTAAAKRAAAQAIVSANGPLLSAPAATSGLDKVDFWPGGMAEKPSVFGGLLGTTFNFVFEHQLEDLQNGDRFYYLQRTDGLNFRFALEGNSFAELCRRNTSVGGTMSIIFDTADFIFDLGTPALSGTAPVILDPATGAEILTLADGTKLFFDPLHQGKNVLFNGTPGNDRATGDVGDDTLYGNAGNDRLKGGEGNDEIIGGDGDDILFGDNGDDILKGGPGNDALSTGPGFGGDIAIGGDGNDFLLGGDDGVEYFGGLGDDVIVDGAMRSEGIFAGPGDDWVYDGDGHDGGIFGDNGNVFDLLAGVGPSAGIDGIGGDDVLGGGPGQDNHWGEDGNDIMLMSEGTNKFFGDFGFDWITLRGWNAPEFIELNLLALPNAPVNFNDLRNRYRFVDGASGWNLDDSINGSNGTLCNPPGEIAECLVVGMELTAGTPPVAEPAVGVPGQVNFRGGSGAAKIAGLTELLGPAAFNVDLNSPAIPGIKGIGFMGGDILLGGSGRDILQGLAGNDLIDGDMWLDVQLRAVLNDGTVKLVWDPRDLVLDVFSDPQRLNPGNISIIRTIRAGTPAVDTAVFRAPLAEYDVTLNANGTVTVAHARVGKVVIDDGTDTLRNIEVLQFADQTIPAPGANVVVVPNVVGLTQAAASAAITGAGLTVGPVTLAFSTTVPAGSVISSAPAAGAFEFPLTAVALVVSKGVLDVTPPFVDITSPADMATVGPIVTATAIATDNIGIAGGVTFRLDGLVVGNDPTAPFSFTYTGLTAGTHILGAEAVDAAGNFDSSTITVNVVLADVTPPTVSVISPANGATVSGTITVSANATDNVAVASVQFLLDGAALGAPVTVPTTPPSTYSVTWNTATAANGTHTLAARATDTSGNVATSAAVTVTVNNAAPVVGAPTVVENVVTNIEANTVGNGRIVSPTITPAANTLIVAFVTSDAPVGGPNTTVSTVTNTGAVLTWTRAALSSVQLGAAEVWWAFTTPAHAAMTVTAQLSRGNVAASMRVVTFSGASALTGTATAIANNPTGTNLAPQVTLTTTRANSLVFMVGNDWDNARTMTAVAGQTVVGQFTPAVGDTYWVQRTTAAVPAVGTAVTMRSTYPAPNTDRWNVAAIEIRTP